MQYEIQNLTERLVSVHCNSGKTCHLPPGSKYEVPEQEIAGNASVEKLLDRKVIAALKKTKAPTKKTAKSKAKPTKARSKKKSTRKKTNARKK
jgi:hypothetical protein